MFFIFPNVSISLDKEGSFLFGKIEKILLKIRITKLLYFSLNLKYNVFIRKDSWAEYNTQIQDLQRFLDVGKATWEDQNIWKMY